MRVAVTGSNGTIGSALISFARSPTVIAVHTSWCAGEIQWDPQTEIRLGAALDGVDAVVQPGRASRVEKRWSDEQKRKILESRVTSNRGGGRRRVPAATRPARVLVSGSAIGFYGDTRRRSGRRDGPAGSDFLAGVVPEVGSGHRRRPRPPVFASCTPAPASCRRPAAARSATTPAVQARARRQDRSTAILAELDHARRRGARACASRSTTPRCAAREPDRARTPSPTPTTPRPSARRCTARPSCPSRSAALKLALGAELVDSLLASQRVAAHASCSTPASRSRTRRSPRDCEPRWRRDVTSIVHGRPARSPTA